jgi:integrase
MSTHASRTGAVITIADVIIGVMENADLSPTKRAEFVSALRTICRALGVKPEDLVANMQHLRKALSAVSPAASGLSAKRWSNLKSLTLAALGYAGVRALPGRYRKPLPPAWEVFQAALSVNQGRYKISRFMGFCAANSVAPEAVTKETFALFKAAIEDDSLLRDPGAVFRDTCIVWNEAAASIPGWPQLRVEVPNRRRDFALAIDAFPASFRNDLEAYLSQKAQPDIFADNWSRPLRAITVTQRRQQLLLLATALSTTGYPIESITGLDVLVQLDNAKAILRYLFERGRSEPTHYLARLATLLKTVARHHIQVDGRQLDVMRGYVRRLTPDKSGFTEKNRAFYRQFADQQVLTRLLMLPEVIVSRIERRNDGFRDSAALIVLALTVAIELAIPLRVGNLVRLRVDRHLHRIHRPGQDDVLMISVPAEETKNGCAIDAELPASVVRLYELYVKRYRPLLAESGSPWLFPGEKGGHRPPGGFGTQLRDFIYLETGIRMTTHQFRHLAAKLYLDAHPGDYETVRRLLGHKSVATTMRFYHELSSMMANRRYSELITGLVAEAAIAKPRKGRETKKPRNAKPPKGRGKKKPRNE